MQFFKRIFQKKATALEHQFDGSEMAAIPAGEFRMGYGEGPPWERPVHTVHIGAFKMGKTPVTQGLWQEVMGTNPSGFPKGDDYPVEMVSWNDCRKFIKKYNQMTGGNYRLPTEAEWEYACRAGTSGDYYDKNIDAIAWHKDNSGGATHPVGQKQPNAFGLYDMSGNVWEWCQDWYDEDYYAVSPDVDPTGPSSGTNRVYRGGTWDFPANGCRSANRSWIIPGYRCYDLGFRLAADSPEAGETGSPIQEDDNKKETGNQAVNLSSAEESNDDSGNIVKNLLQKNRVNNFSALLEKIKENGIDLHHALDGGAGYGSTAKAILSCIDKSCCCYAFEPFPGNHRFFPQDTPRLVLIKKALSNRTGQAYFNVPGRGIIQPGSEWGKKGMVGYSSAGYIVNEETPTSFTVECVRADDIIPVDQKIGFIKLDLQGGELSALQGMPRILANCCCLWIEFMGQNDLFDFLASQDFIIFDTEYLFRGEPGGLAYDDFKVSQKDRKLSGGGIIWKGYRKKNWPNYLEQFEKFKKTLKLVQTDLFCLNKKYINEFYNAFSQTA